MKKIIRYQLIPQVLLGGVLALSHTGLSHGEPRAGLLDQVQLDTDIDELSNLGDALTEHDVEFRCTEGGRHLIFDHFGLDMVAHHLTADLQRLHLAHVNADGGVELEGPSAGGDLGVAVHHAHLFPELVDKDRSAP